MVKRRFSLAHAAYLAAIIAAIIGAGGCAGARSAAPRTPVPIGGFSVSSMRSAYGIQGVLNGVLVRRGDWLTVTIDSGAVRTQQADPERIWDLRLRAGIATCTADGRWEVTSESRALRVAPLVGVSSREGILDASLRPFRSGARLDLAIPPEARIERSWVVLTFEWPFENELATYSLDVNLPLDGAVSARGARAPGETTHPAMRLRCAAS
ncbi:MAG TPA: hypothetical protein VLE53_07320 [Gemmatimonadaceae bacterium]|nr:hypothetical protein [Gemmatimonadaceae bacterium]